MRLEVQRVPLPRVQGAAVLHLAGVIDTTTLNEFEQRLQETTEDGFDRLLLDLEKVRYINSSGFGALVKYSDHFRARGGGMALIQIPAKVQVVLEMLGLQAFFPIYHTQAEAEAALETGAAFSPTESEAPEPKAARPAAAPRRAPATAARSKPAPRTPTKPPEPAAPLGYPLTISCAVCSASLEIKASGAYRCPGCSSVFKAGPECHVTFPETAADVSASHVAVDTGPTGRRAFKAIVGSLAEPLLVGRSSALIGDAVEEICDWLQSATGGQPVRFNALLLAGEKALRIDIAESGALRSTDGLSRTRALFESISTRRVSEGRNLTRLVLTRTGVPADRTTLLESHS